MTQPTALNAAQHPATARVLWGGIFLLNISIIGHLSLYLRDMPLEFTAAAQVKLWIGLIAALLFIGITLRQWIANAPPVAPGEPLHTAFALGAPTFLLILALLPVPPYTAPHLMNAHMLLGFTVTLLTGYRLLFNGDVPLRRWRLLAIALGVLAVVVTLIRLYGLATHPFVDLQDEAWVTAWAVNWLRTGQFGDPTLFGLGDAYYAYPRFYWLLAGWIRLFGIGLWQERLLGFVLIFPVIAFTAAAARQLYGLRVAVLTAVALFASAVLLSAARVRHDIGLAICVAVALWLYTEAVKHKSGWRHFLAGLVIGLGMFSHYHAAGFGVALLIGLYLPTIIKTRRFDRNLIWFGAGGLAGFLTVVLVQMLPDNLSGWWYIITRISKYSDDTNQFFVAFFGNFINIGFFSIFELILVSVGVLMALRRRRTRDVSLLLILLIGHLLLAVMASGAIYYYILPLTPIYGILIGAIFVGRREGRVDLPFQRGQVVLFALLLMPLLGANTARPLQAVVNGEQILAVTPPAVQWVLDNVPTDHVVAGDLYYYFWLYDYPFASHLLAEYLYPENETRYPTLEAVWEAAAPDYIIIDPAYERSYVKFFVPLMATGWFNAHYTLVQDFDDTLSGAQIYRRHIRDASKKAPVTFPDMMTVYMVNYPLPICKFPYLRCRAPQQIPDG